MISKVFKRNVTPFHSQYVIKLPDKYPAIQIVTFEDLLEVPAAGLRELLGQVDKKVLATAMKGASEEMTAHISEAMSSRAAEMLKEDMDALGSLRPREVQAAQQQVAELARKLEAEGKLIRRSAEDENAV